MNTLSVAPFVPELALPQIFHELIVLLVGSAESETTVSFVTTTQGIAASRVSSLSSAQSSPIESADTGSPISKIRDLISPEDYPAIEAVAKVNAERMALTLSDRVGVLPSRIAPSVEGGVAVVYTKVVKKLFRNIVQELFVESYNDGDLVVSYSENLHLEWVSETNANSEDVLKRIEGLSFAQASQ